MRVYIALATVVAALFLLPQGARGNVTCSVDTVRFGNIRESDGEKTVRIYVRNDGDSPVAITRVRPTCGCTAAHYYKDMIQPADSAWVDLTYSPYRRPGRFTKHVRIYTSASEDPIILPITGTVFSSDDTLDAIYPEDGGDVRIANSTIMPLGAVSGVGNPFYVDLYNPGDTPVYLKLENPHEAINVDYIPNPVPPGSKGLISLYVVPRKEKEPGNKHYVLPLFTASSPQLLESTPESAQINLIVEVKPYDSP